MSNFRPTERHAERRRRGGAHYAVRGEPVGALEQLDRALRPRAEYPVHRARIVAPVFELLLHGFDIGTRAAPLEHPGRCRTPARGSAARERHAERRRRGGAHYAVRGEPVGALKQPDGALRPRAEYPVHRARIIAPVFELLLHGSDIAPRAPSFEHGRLGVALGQSHRKEHRREDEHYDDKSQRRFSENSALHNSSAASFFPPAVFIRSV